MSASVHARLSAMMFIQFFIWGAWFVTLGTYLARLGFGGADIGFAYLTNNIGAMVAPFLVGMVADRFFSSEKLLGVLHICGALMLFIVSDLVAQSAIIIGLVLYNICYMPTLALVNSVSFGVMNTPDTEFPKVRVWGTLGWIAAGLVISFGLSGFVSDVEATSVPMKLAAGASLLLGLYSFTLPSTPPQNAGSKTTMRDLLGLDALALLKDRSFAVFALCSLLVSIPLAFYYAFTNLFLNEAGMSSVAATMSLGQASEVFFMVLMPLLFVRLGVKWMLLAGMLAWVLRYALFAAGDWETASWMLYGGILLHGICYDFFFVTGQIYVDQKADKSIRASAQGFIAMLTYGVGLAIGSVLAGATVDYFTAEGVKDWPSIWWVPCIFAAFVALLFQVTFKDDTKREKAAEVPARP
ncbi:nucleoside permease [Kordiimonas sp.]|uniref:nucleoside permease n=1 Tax=Kordiimonas sp. TaxID=1970157 RepID=UPI003A9065F4